MIGGVLLKFAHLSDLHIGKIVNGFKMLEDQKIILGNIVADIGRENVDAVFISGDVYDKALPSAEAVELFDFFLSSLNSLGVEVFLISGNHDSSERLSFAHSILDCMRVHISPTYSGSVPRYDLPDNISVFLLPFIKPFEVSRLFPEEEILSYTDALRVALSQADVDPVRFNILLSHQFVTGSSLSGSEEVSVGGLDNVDYSVFDAFDYVALGHIHRSQRIYRDGIRYSGSIMKYSFSEAEDVKSFLVLEVEGKDDISIREVPIMPVHEMRKLRGRFSSIMAKDGYDERYCNDYYQITLTDDEDIPGCLESLRKLYPNLMRLEYDNARTRAGLGIDFLEDMEEKSPFEIFSEFFEMQNGKKMSPEEEEYMKNLMDDIFTHDDEEML